MKITLIVLLMLTVIAFGGSMYTLVSLEELIKTPINGLPQTEMRWITVNSMIEKVKSTCSVDGELLSKALKASAESADAHELSVKATLGFIESVESVLLSVGLLMGLMYLYALFQLRKAT